MNNPLIPETPDSEVEVDESFANPVRSVRAAIDGRPTITNFKRLKAFPNRFEIYFPNENRVAVVPRNPGENAVQAVRRFLQGGAQ